MKEEDLQTGAIRGGETPVSDLGALGFHPHLRTAWLALRESPDWLAGRVFDERRGVYTLMASGRDEGPPTSVEARVAGRMRHRLAATADLPAIGDWVGFAPARPGGSATIHAVLPRATKLARKVSGERSDEQVLAANVDTAVILMGLDGDLNLRRLDRYVALARAGGVHPLVLLTKADLLGLRGDEEPAAAATPAGADDEARRLVETVASSLPEVTVVPVSLPFDSTLPGALVRELGLARTLAMLGSSGAGKSTLLNRLLGWDRQKTGAVRASDSRGRHTTTHRQMFLLPGGAMMIDSPGLREIQLHVSEALPEDAFPDIAGFARDCRFRDCQHELQPGCAVEAAVVRGDMAEHRLVSYRRLSQSHAARAAAKDVSKAPGVPRGGSRRDGSKLAPE